MHQAMRLSLGTRTEISGKQTLAHYKENLSNNWNTPRPRPQWSHQPRQKPVFWQAEASHQRGCKRVIHIRLGLTRSLPIPISFSTFHSTNPHI